MLTSAIMLSVALFHTSADHDTPHVTARHRNGAAPVATIALTQQCTGEYLFIERVDGKDRAVYAVWPAGVSTERTGVLVRVPADMQHPRINQTIPFPCRRAMWSITLSQFRDRVTEELRFFLGR